MIKHSAGLIASCSMSSTTDDQHQRYGHEGWVCYCCLIPGKGICLLRGFVACLEWNLLFVSDDGIDNLTLMIRYELEACLKISHSHPHYIPAIFRSAVFLNNLPSDSTPWPAGIGLPSPVARSTQALASFSVGMTKPFHVFSKTAPSMVESLANRSIWDHNVLPEVHRQWM